MKTIGVVAEYNPFHNGHAYHLAKSRREAGEEAAVIAREAGVEGFVAVGGGSSIDLAKAVNVLMTNPGKIGEYGGIEMVKNPCLPLIAIPTTAGTSSEITNVSALIDTEKVRVRVLSLAFSGALVDYHSKEKQGVSAEADCNDK